MGDFHTDRRKSLAAACSLGTRVLQTLAWGREAADSAPEVRVGPVRRVGAAGEKHIEPWIVANPRDASNLVVVGSRPPDGSFHLLWVDTRDGRGEVQTAKTQVREEPSQSSAFRGPPTAHRPMRSIRHH